MHSYNTGFCITSTGTVVFTLTGIHVGFLNQCSLLLRSNNTGDHYLNLKCIHVVSCQLI